MNISTIPTIYARRRNIMPLSNTDKDALAQKALLGESVYQLEDNTPSSPINTPSPSLDGLSPLSVASHLQDASDGPFQVKDINPFLDASWKSTTSRMLDESDSESPDLVRVCQPQYL